MNLVNTKELMIELHLKGRDIVDTKVLKAMKDVPRDMFVPEFLQDQAYADYPLPIGEDQTISQPYIVALMTQLLELKGKEKVLEVGTGLGYQAAVLSKLTKKVYSIEINEKLAKKAELILKKLKYNNIKVIVGDGSRGYKKAAPYDAIIVTAAARKVPEMLIEQLKEGGRLVVPVGNFLAQELIRIIKKDGKTKKESVCGVRFVPLKGDY